ncbi:MAG: glycerate kinase family protein, partial [Armatimonadota bacterium]
IDMSGFKFPVDRVKVEVACDVSNPLCGSEGASAVFGPQKGATPEMVRLLDHALANYARVIAKDIGREVGDVPGAGAAGGFGAGLAAFLNAELRSGIDMVLDAVHFSEKIIGADLIITGEGKIDDQTAFGKTIAGVLKRTSPLKIPVVAIGGALEGDIGALYDMGLMSAFSITRGPITLDYAIRDAAELIRSVSENIVRLITGQARILRTHNIVNLAI